MAREYKDSGIDWIGRIPKDWKVTKLFNLCTIKGRIGWNGLRSDEFKEKSFAYLVTGQDFVSSDINWKNCYQIGKERYDEDPCIQLSNGDILITKDGTIGKIAKVRNMDKPACLNSGIFVLKQRKGTFDQNYLYWYLVSPILLSYNAYVNSGGTTIMHLYQNVFERFPLIIPTISEQQRIADYLDKKCAEIDSLVELQEQMIAQLTDYKQSVITEAVTKGLNPEAELVPSGIDWIGDVPKGWKVCRIKDIFRLRTGTTPKGFEQGLDSQELVNWFTPSDVAEMNCELSSSERHLSKEVIEKEGIELNPAGSLIFVGIGNVGKIGYATVEGYSNQQITTLIPKQNKCFSKYSYYYMIADRKRIRDNAFYTILPIINNSYLSGVKSLLPPLEEQHAIASYLDAKCREIDSLIDLKRQKIEALKDYKKSIIFEAVTGKTNLEET